MIAAIRGEGGKHKRDATDEKKPLRSGFSDPPFLHPNYVAARLRAGKTAVLNVVVMADYVVSGGTLKPVPRTR
jgi:hypothetical protein